jgi:hypothetical protein
VRYSILSEATFVYCEKIHKKEFCVLIKHCFLAKKNTVEAKVLTLHQQNQPLKSAKLKQGEVCIESDARCGRPKEAVSDENIKKVHKMFLNDHKVKLIEIAETLKISKKRTYWTYCA